MNSTATTARNQHSARPSRAKVQPVETAFVPDSLLTWPTVVALSGLSETSLRRHRAADPSFPPLIKVGRAARFRADAFRAWLAAQRPSGDTTAELPQSFDLERLQPLRPDVLADDVWPTPAPTSNSEAGAIA